LDVVDGLGFIQDPVGFARKRGTVAVIGRMMPYREIHGRRWLELALKIPVVNLGFDPLYWSAFPVLVERARRFTEHLHYVGPDEAPGYGEVLDHGGDPAAPAVAFIGTDMKPYTWSRLDALRAACAQRGLPPPEAFFATPETRLLKKLSREIKRPGFPRRLFFESDRLAASFLDIWPGGKPSSDFRLCGFDDAPLRVSEHGTNPFTTLRQDFPSQGRLAVRLVRDLLKGSASGGQRLLVPVCPVFRDRKNPKGPTDDEFRRHATAALARHLSDVRASWEVAQDLGLSQEYFLVRFQKTFREKFTRALADARVKRAAFLLKSTASTILDVQMECGFGTHQSFSRHFRRIHGLTPGAFREREEKHAGARMVRPHPTPHPASQSSRRYSR
jgi:AraC-like DNA-binding protein